jgi:dephospho-CoA kinase
MSLFLVTGTAGTGKSQVCRALKGRGYEAYDVDDDGLARWQHNHTGYVHPKSSVKAHQRTAEFIAEHSWNVPREYVEELGRKAVDKVVFICGSITNREQLSDLFSKVFALHVDEETLKHRLATRTGNDWGKQPHELQQTLEMHRSAYDQYQERGDEIIDAAQSVDGVVDDILRSVNVE